MAQGDTHWSINLTLSYDGEFFHLNSIADGPSEEETLTVVKLLKSIIEDEGYELFMREEPSVATDLDFDRQEAIHRGFVRFSFK